MGDRDDIKKAKPSIYSSFKLDVFRSVHPLKDRKYKYRNGKGHDDNFVDEGNLQVAIHAIV